MQCIDDGFACDEVRDPFGGPSRHRCRKCGQWYDAFYSRIPAPTASPNPADLPSGRRAGAGQRPPAELAERPSTQRWSWWQRAIYRLFGGQ